MFLAASLMLLVEMSVGPISEDRVLILVNDASPVSHYAAERYRDYHPDVPESHVVALAGMPDITSSADEIITRSDFESLIAQPVRQHLLTQGLVDHIWVILTTAGMPYRIADTTYANVVYPHRSDAGPVLDHTELIDAASVESELTVLWQIDPALDPNHRAPIAARIVNPYHGYTSPIEACMSDRDILGRRETFHFAPAPADPTRVFEGETFGLYRVQAGRRFSIKDMYLVCRLDGPRAAGSEPYYYINRSLEWAARASDPNHPHFHGMDPDYSLVVIDDKLTGSVSDSNKWYNAGSAVALDALPEDYLTCDTFPLPPEVLSNGPLREDYSIAFRSLTGQLPDPNQGLSVGTASSGRLIRKVVYDATDQLMDRSYDPNCGVVALCSFGIHQAGVGPTYLLDGGPSGKALVRPVYGGVFNSTESFNAVTFFVDVPTPAWAQQGLIAYWFAIGGSAALGHAFEPMSDAVADNDLVFLNYFADLNGDQVGDLTFVEAAYSGVPYISWATVVVGDPLLSVRITSASGPGWSDISSCGAGLPTVLALGLACLLLVFLTRLFLK